MRWRGWRTLGLAIVSGLILLLLAGLLAWLAALVAGLAGLAALHFLLLPRLAARLRVSTFALGLLLLPALAAVGWGLGRREGLVIAAVFWGAGVALPRLAIGRLERALSLRVAVRTGSSPNRTEADWGQPRAL